MRRYPYAAAAIIAGIIGFIADPRMFAAFVAALIVVTVCGAFLLLIIVNSLPHAEDYAPGDGTDGLGASHGEHR